ncbi:hypothetical protein ACQR18_18140 [Bradyrhizobium oligotrophicum]|uniref:hypothetical protein n=1 Tax=Bradyrhizobium TaxID=374 RepID=UPI0029161A24|nr:hypothetical protein [Bradyrhizobium sp. SZCCHNR3003]
MADIARLLGRLVRRELSPFHERSLHAMIAMLHRLAPRKEIELHLVPPVRSMTTDRAKPTNVGSSPGRRRENVTSPSDKNNRLAIFRKS